MAQNQNQEAAGEAARQQRLISIADMRLISGVANMLRLNENLLLHYLPEVLPDELLTLLHREEDVMPDAIIRAVVRVANTLIDYEAWDAYSGRQSQAPSAYIYAAAVVSWMYMFAYGSGSYIPLGCPLFDRRVAAAITEFLATAVAYPVYEALRDAIAESSRRLRKRLEDEEVLIQLCTPSPLRAIPSPQ